MLHFILHVFLVFIIVVVLLEKVEVVHLMVK